MTYQRIDCWADLPAAIVSVEQAGAVGLATLLRALNQGKIALLRWRPSAARRSSGGGQQSRATARLWR